MPTRQINRHPHMRGEGARTLIGLPASHHPANPAIASRSEFKSHRRFEAGVTPRCLSATIR